MSPMNNILSFINRINLESILEIIEFYESGNDIHMKMVSPDHMGLLFMPKKLIQSLLNEPIPKRMEFDMLIELTFKNTNTKTGDFFSNKKLKTDISYLDPGLSGEMYITSLSEGYQFHYSGFTSDDVWDDLSFNFDCADISAKIIPESLQKKRRLWQHLTQPSSPETTYGFIFFFSLIIILFITTKKSCS